MTKVLDPLVGCCDRRDQDGISVQFSRDSDAAGSESLQLIEIAAHRIDLLSLNQGKRYALMSADPHTIGSILAQCRGVFGSTTRTREHAFERLLCRRLTHSLRQSRLCAKAGHSSSKRSQQQRDRASHRGAQGNNIEPGQTVILSVHYSVNVATGVPCPIVGRSSA